MRSTQDERMLAALAHASIVANLFNLAGMFAALLIWVLQRERSAFVRAHALQALLYQAMVLLISIVMAALWGVCLVVSLLPAAMRPDLYRASPPYSFWIALLGLALPLGYGLLATLYGLYGAYQVYRGRPFRYPLAGRVAGASVDSTAPAADAPTAPPLVVPNPLPPEPAPPAEE